jgi:hypothetical protein
MERDSKTRSGAKDPWGREGILSNSGLRKRQIALDTEPGNATVDEAGEGWVKLAVK